MDSNNKCYKQAVFLGNPVHSCSGVWAMPSALPHVPSFFLRFGKCGVLSCGSPFVLVASGWGSVLQPSATCQVPYLTDWLDLDQLFKGIFGLFDAVAWVRKQITVALHVGNKRAWSICTEVVRQELCSAVQPQASQGCQGAAHIPSLLSSAIYFYATHLQTAH